MIEIACTPGSPVSDFCEADGVVSDCIAELGNALTGGIGYFLAAVLLTIFSFRLNFPSKLFLLPLFLFCFSVSTAIFHINLSLSASFAGTYSLYAFFFVLNLTLIHANPEYKSWKAYSLLSIFFIGSVFGDYLMYQMNEIRSIDGMFSFGYFLATVYLLFKFQKSFPAHRTQFFTIRTLMLAQILILVKLVEALVPCDIDILGACRWVWHLVSAFVAFYSAICVGLISLEANEGVSDPAMAFLLKNCPFIPRSLRHTYADELEDSVDEISVIAAKMGVKIKNDVTMHPDVPFAKFETPQSPRAAEECDGDVDEVEATLGDAESIMMRVRNADEQSELSEIVTEIDQELDQIEEFLLSIVN